eukprot:1851938-Pleurochrysis_carterae.AAC.1
MMRAHVRMGVRRFSASFDAGLPRSSYAILPLLATCTTARQRWWIISSRRRTRSTRRRAASASAPPSWQIAGGSRLAPPNRDFGMAAAGEKLWGSQSARSCCPVAMGHGVLSAYVERGSR